VKGVITLQGPVASKKEKMKIGNLVRSMSGKKKIYNRLTY
jgi:osmotically-inducible protein OsmY